jgi:hypothetical protein
MNTDKNNIFAFGEEKLLLTDNTVSQGLLPPPGGLN